MTGHLHPSTASPLGRRLQSIEGQLTKSEAVVAQWLSRNEAGLGPETGASIATKTGVSEITVSRFLRRLGYQGLSALKEDMQSAGTAQIAVSEMYLRLLDGEIGTLIRRDAEAMLAIASQVSRPEWEAAVTVIQKADDLFVTGFQSVKGVAEDFTRRLSIVRDQVNFLSAHDAGLAEWITKSDRRRCLILIDTVPYAREAEPIVKLAVAAGMDVVVVTDELNTWAATHSPFVFFVTSKIGTFVESTGPLASILNLITHAVAALDPEGSRKRLAAWYDVLRELGLFR
jgi:DNA-binding MurR/RpiR family transcriptional regulator